MNNNFNEWYIEAGISLTEGQKRLSSIEIFMDVVKVNDIINLVKLFYGLPVNEEFTNTFAEVFIKNDLSFSRKNKQELAVLAGAVLVQIAEADGDNCYFVELVTLAASYGGRVPVVSGILSEIKQTFIKDSYSIRETNPAKNEHVKPPTSNPLIESLEDNWTSDTSKNLREYINKIEASFSELYKIVSEISESQDIYHEDSQLLWWLTSGWSPELNCSYKTIDKQSACFLIGKEAAELVNVFPGPYSIKGVFNKMLESCKRNKTNIPLTDIIYATDNDWKTKYVGDYNDPILIELLPLTAALIHSENTSSKEEWISKYTQEIHVSVKEMKYSPLEYAMQIYLEVLAQRCYCNLQNN